MRKPIYLLLEKKINKTETIKRVENLLDRYWLIKIRLEEDYPNITSILSPIGGGEFIPGKSKVENYVFRKEDAIRYLETIEHAVEQLPELERRIIKEKYLSKEYISDIELYKKLMLSERSYYRYRNSALINLGILLNVAVYE